MNKNNDRLRNPVNHNLHNHAVVQKLLPRTKGNQLNCTKSSLSNTQLLHEKFSSTPAQHSASESVVMKSETKGISQYTSAINPNIKIAEHSTKQVLCDSKILPNSGNSSFGRFFEPFTNHQPNASLTYPYVAEYHYGMELTPGTFVHLSVPYSEVNSEEISLPITPRNTYDSIGDVSVIGLVIDANTVAPVNVCMPPMNSKSWETSSPQNPTLLKQSPQANIISSDQPKNFPVFYCGLNSNTNSKCLSYHTNLHDSSSCSVTPRPPPPLQMTLGTESSTCVSEVKNQVKNKVAPYNSSYDQYDTFDTVKQYNCVYCKFACDTVNDLNVHMLMHNVNPKQSGKDSIPNVKKTKEIPPLAPTIFPPSSSYRGDFFKSRSTCNNCGNPFEIEERAISNSLGSSSLAACDNKKLINWCNSCGSKYESLRSGKLENAPLLAEYHILGDQFKTNLSPQQHKYRSLTDSGNHHAERYYCTRCDKNYKYNRDLRKHEKVVHGLKRQQLSKLVKNNFHNNNNHHQQQQQLFSDRIIDQTHLNSLVQLDYNYSNADTGEQNIRKSRYHCNKCLKSFRGPFELRRHIATVHEHKKSFRCGLCGKYFRDAYEIKRHNVSQHMKFFEDVTLGENMTSFGNTVSEEMSKLALKYNTTGNDRCAEGEGDVPHGDNNVELSTVATITAVPDYNDLISRPGNSGTVKPNSTTINSSVSISHHPNTSFKKNAISNRVHNISTCSNKNKEYYCGICNRDFRGSTEFRRHYMTVHEKKYRYKCIHCGKLWRDQYDLKRHCRRGHFFGKEIDKAFIRKCLIVNSCVNSNYNKDQNESLVNDSFIESTILDSTSHLNSIKGKTNSTKCGRDSTMLTSITPIFDRDDDFTRDNDTNFYNEANTYSRNDQNIQKLSNENTDNNQALLFASQAQKPASLAYLNNDLTPVVMNDLPAIVSMLDSQPDHICVEPQNNSFNNSTTFFTYNNSKRGHHQDHV